MIKAETTPQWADDAAKIIAVCRVHQTHTDASCMDYLYRTGCIHNNLFKQMSADFIRAVAFAIRLVAVAVLIWAVRWW